jgi:hypothetical protein
LCDKSNQKRLSVERLLCRTGLCPANQAKPGLQTVARLRSHAATASANICYALPALMATIVLPYFGRSCSSDGKKKINTNRK